jgi:hypothetical protein
LTSQAQQQQLLLQQDHLWGCKLRLVQPVGREAVPCHPAPAMVLLRAIAHQIVLELCQMAMASRHLLKQQIAKAQIV